MKARQIFGLLHTVAAPHRSQKCAVWNNAMRMLREVQLETATAVIAKHVINST
jgi:hypothetical protein